MKSTMCSAIEEEMKKIACVLSELRVYWVELIVRLLLFKDYLFSLWSFPDSSVVKESAWNAGDPGPIPGLVRSSGKRIGYSLQYPCASLVTQLVKNLPAKQETWIWSLGWEDPLEKEMAIHSNILARRIPWTEEPGRLQSMGFQESDTT